MTTVPEQFVSNRPNSWTDYLQTLSSLRPRLHNPHVAPFPTIDGPTPTDTLGAVLFPSGHPTLIAFVRHCGCPFAEKEVRSLAAQAVANPDLRVLIVQHSPARESLAWFERIRGPELFGGAYGGGEKGVGGRVQLVADPGRELYAKWGVGHLGWTRVVNGDIMTKLHEQKLKEGLDLTKSDWSAYRWQNSAGFAVDAQGIVRWAKLAEDSSDLCDWEEAARKIGEGMA